MASLAHTWAEPDLYILADDQLVHSSENVRRRLCRVEKSPDPIIVPDRPWEGMNPDGSADSLQDPLYGTCLFDPDEGIFRYWYNAYTRYQNRMSRPPLTSQGYSCCLAVSEDGLTWRKPDVRQVLFDGRLQNNMLRFKEEAAKGSSNLGEQVWNVLPYSAPGSEDRFVASMFCDWEDPIFTTGITMCYSPDGINWRMHYPPVLGLEGDCHGMSWDPNGQCYLLTTRSHQHTNLCKRWNHPWKRHIALFRSRDLLHWTSGTTILEADDRDPEDAQLYLMLVIPYGHCYLGQLLMFYGHEMVLDNQLAVSRDLFNWRRVDREPILCRGDEGSWDSRHVALSHNQPHPEGEQMRFWYGGKNTPHYQAGYGAIGTGTLRRDGFVCYEASGKEGTLTTAPFRPPRPNSATWIIVNADASEGEILAEIVDLDGNPIEGVTRADCIPVRGDHTRKVLAFKAGPGEYFHRGNFLRFAQDIRVRFILRDAKLYSFKLTNYALQTEES